MIEFDVKIEGAAQALKALAALEPQVGREVKQAINGIGQDLAAEVRNRAPGEPPVSGWRATPGGWPAWTTVQTSFRRAQTTIIVQTRSGGDNKIASMVEYVGNGTKIRTDKGARLSAMFNERLGATVPVTKRSSRSRLGGKVLMEMYPRVVGEIEKACDRAVSEVNRRMP